MRIVAFVTAIAVCLSACAGYAIKDKMSAYNGQPVSTLIDKLGFPTRQDTIAGQTVYIWTTGQMIEGTSYACTIRAILDSQNIITRWDYQGNEGGCARYASMLR